MTTLITKNLTKTKKAPPIPRERFPICFDSDTIGGCCGSVVFHSFQQRRREYHWSKGTLPIKPLASVEEVLKCLDTDFKKQWSSRFEGRIRDNELFSSIILITRYRGPTDNQGQIPGLSEHLQKTGWTVDRQWVNYNTGNHLTSFSQIVSSVGYPELEESVEEDEDDWLEETDDEDGPF